MKSLSYTFSGLLLIVWLISTVAIVPVKAEGSPIDFSKFGYGARIDPWGDEVDAALKAASDAALDWISIDFDWEHHWPDQNSTLDLADLNHAMSYAEQHNMKVLISVTHAPAWARKSQGPDPDLTAGLVALFSRLYPKSLLAVELFPSANTIQGWGATPNPEAYTNLLKIISRKLEVTGRPTLLVAAGLEPVFNTSSQNIDDLEYLQGLYEAGAKNYLSVIGIRLPATDNAPLTPPWKADPRVLRHYESVRSIMLKNQHSNGRIWVTSFYMPVIQPANSEVVTSTGRDADSIGMDDQESWFNQAVPLMKSQLYIGAVFYGCMNPSLKRHLKVDETTCLIQSEGSMAKYHPAYLSFSQMIALDKASALAPRSKDRRTYQIINNQALLKSGAP